MGPYGLHEGIPWGLMGAMKALHGTASLVTLCSTDAFVCELN